MNFIDEKTEEGLKKAITRLIAPSKDYGIKDLDALYHNNMVVVMVDEKEHTAIFYKEEFKKLIAATLNAKNKQSNTWVHFHHTEINENSAFMVMKRKVNLTGEKRNLHVCLDFVWEGDRWQIIKENIYSQPLD